MAACSLPKAKRTKIESIATLEEEAQNLDQWQGSWFGNEERLTWIAVSTRVRTASELEDSLNLQLEYVQRLISTLNIDGVVSKEVCTMWQNTFAKDVLVPCSQETRIISSAATSHFKYIKKRDELGQKLKEAEDQCTDKENVIGELTERLKNQQDVHDEVNTKLRATIDDKEMSFAKQLEERNWKIEELEKAQSRLRKVLKGERSQYDSLREANEKMIGEDKTKTEQTVRLRDDLALEQAGHDSLRTMYYRQREKMATLEEENTKGKRTISGLGEELKVNHEMVRTLVESEKGLKTLKDEQERAIAAKDGELTRIRLSEEELKVTVSEQEKRLTNLEGKLQQLTNDNIRLLETNEQQSRTVQGLQSQLDTSIRESVREKQTSAKALESVLYECRMIADSENNDMLLRAEKEYRVSKSRMHDSHRRSQQYLRQTIHNLERKVLEKETLINVLLDRIQQNTISYDQKERAEFELREQLDSRIESQRAFEAITEEEKRSTRDEIATLKHRLQEQADNHRYHTRRLEEGLEAAQLETKEMGEELERSNHVSAMRHQIIEDMYGDGLCENALAQFDIRTRRLETELPGPSKLRVDFQNSRFHGYNSNSDLTAEEIARKVLRFLWRLQTESARSGGNEYTDMIDIWRVWEDPRSMSAKEKARIFYVLFDFSIHVIKTARTKEVWPFLQWLVLELLNALIRYGATEAHLKQVNDQILGGNPRLQAQIVSMGYMHLEQAIRLRMMGLVENPLHCCC